MPRNKKIIVSRYSISPDRLQIFKEESLKAAINFIDRQGNRMAVVTDDRNKIVGLVSDGDIRRAIIKGEDLSSPIEKVMNINPLYISIERSIDVDKEKFQQFLNSYLQNDSFIAEISKRIKSGNIIIPYIDSLTKEFLGGILVSVVDIEKDLQISTDTDLIRIPTPVKNVLVIGGAGYIGTHLVDLLITNNKSVRVLDNFLWGKETRSRWEDDDRVEVIEGDVRHIETVIEAVKGMDAVCHLAALVGDPACGLDFETTLATNYLSAVEVAEVCKYFQLNRFIFASTCSVYGASSEKKVLTEESSLNPVSTYARTKIEAEKALMKMMDKNFTPTILRKATVYGLSARMRFDLVTNLFVANAFFKGELTIYGGDQWRPFIHVKDAAQAYIDVLSAPISEVGGQIFNLGNTQENYTITQIGQIIKEFLPDVRIITEKTLQDKRNYYVNFDKIMKILNYQTQKTVKDGIKEILVELKNGRFKDWHKSKYSNYKRFKELSSPMDAEW
ncbi:MAG: NAD-dependent epimerase/dehydratase family protein [Promethearchaeota archaeon]